MARQRIHNQRAGRSSAGGGASWISYSDMMAALLLVFVLILCVSLYQYFQMLAIKSQELEDQKAIVSAQQTTLESQSLQMAAQQVLIGTQSVQLAAQQTELDNQLLLLSLKQDELDAASAALAEKQTALDTATTALAEQQTALDNATATLTIQQAALDSATTALAEKQTALDAAAAALEEREATVAALQQQVTDQQDALATQATKLDALVGVRSRIITELSSALSAAHLNAAVDPTTGDIVLESTVFFKTGKYEIKEEGQALLNAFVPVYLDVLLRPEYRDYLGEIIIEGHTDSTGTYMNNLELSQNRALAVAKYVLQMNQLSAGQIELLQTILTATGRSDSDPVLYPNGQENYEASRRVEFKFSLKDAEMIQEMNRLLQSTGLGGNEQ